MEIIKSRYGSDRVIEKIDTNRMKIVGESLFYNVQKDNDGNIKMFDFEGGPSISINQTVKFKKVDWVVTSINSINTIKENLIECVFGVKMK